MGAIHDETHLKKKTKLEIPESKLRPLLSRNKQASPLRHEFDQIQ